MRKNLLFMASFKFDILLLVLENVPSYCCRRTEKQRMVVLFSRWSDKKCRWNGGVRTLKIHKNFISTHNWSVFRKQISASLDKQLSTSEMSIV